jgi:transcriptional regulator with XRE-family HTH domain
MSDIIKALREIRVERGQSLQKLATEMGMESPSGICNWESGKRSPTLPLLAHWADTLGYELTLRPKE